MRTTLTAAAVLAALALAACGPATTGSTPQRRTTTISLPGAQGGVDEGMGTGSGTVTIASYNDVGPVAVNLQVPPDTVWKLLPVVYQLVQIPLGTLDPPNKLLGNRRLTLMGQHAGTPLSRFVSCGTTGMGANVADTYRVSLSVESRVLPHAQGSTLETTVQATASQPSVSNATVQCFSTGALERRISREVEQALLNRGR